MSGRIASILRAIAVLAIVGVALPACSEVQNLTCKSDDTSMILMAQAVPSATLLPCIEVIPSGWSFGGAEIEAGEATFWLNSDRGGFPAVEVTLTEACNTSGALEEPAIGEPGTRLFVRTYRLDPVVVDSFHTFPGGCVTYEMRFQSGAPTTLTLEVDQALGFVLRSRFVGLVEKEVGVDLCGANAPPCPG
jgi:hypothetical protein